jgi:hypothetical protein
MSVYERLLAQINEMHIIDTHEHLSPFEGTYDPADVPPREVNTGCFADQQIYDENTNVVDNLILGNYLFDLVSAGNKPYYGWQARTVEEKWQALQPMWDDIRFSGYAQVIKIAIKDLLGFDEITAENIGEINSRYLATLKKGHYRKYIKEMGKVDICILDGDLHHDKEIMCCAHRMDHFVMPVLQQHFHQVEAFTGLKIRNFDDWMHAAEVTLDKLIEMGITCLKCGLAYKRSLYFPRASYAEAEASFNEFYAKRFYPGWEPQRFMTNEAFENFMMHYVCKLAEDRGMVMQVHTGLMVGGGGNYIEHANPENLSNLCIEYPGLKFDIFHIGYPYQQPLLAMAYMFRNVYVDLCWAQMFSPVAARNFLSEALEMIPHNKIMGFGGDVGSGMAVYAAAKLAKQYIARVLAEKVSDGIMTEDEAVMIAQKILYDNPKELFNLKL